MITPMTKTEHQPAQANSASIQLMPPEQTHTPKFIGTMVSMSTVFRPLFCTVRGRDADHSRVFCSLELDNSQPLLQQHWGLRD